MACDPQALTLAPSEWDEHAARLLAPAAPCDLEDVRAQVEQGRARLFTGTTGQGGPLLAFVLRVDHLTSGPQGVIVAAAGQLQGVDLIDTCMPAIEGLFIGCTSIRYHTRNPALARRLARKGYAAQEIVCRKNLDHDHLAP